MSSGSRRISALSSMAPGGFTPAQVAQFHAAWEWKDVLRAGDVSRYMFLRFSEFYPMAVVHRTGVAVALEEAPDVAVGAARLPTSEGLTLDEYLASPDSGAQGMIVVHRGQT